MRRTCRAVVTLALFAVVAAPGAARSATGTFCSGTSDAGGGWLASRPSFAAGPAAVTLAVSPAFAPDVVYATNGAVISRSEDGGCSWVPAYAATAARGPAGIARITSLAAPSSASSSSFVYAGVRVDLADGVSLPRVVSSDNRGKDWAAASPTSGLPLTGSVLDVVPNALLPQTAYAVVDLGLSEARVTVYATNDAGVSWAERSSLDGFTGSQLTANPLTQTQLFAIDGQRVGVSGDGAATFARAKGDSGRVGAFSLATGAGGVRLAAARTDADAVSRSDDAGATWRTLKVPLRARDVAMAPLQDYVAVADDSNVFLVSQLGAFRLSPSAGAPDQLGISAPTAAGVAVTGVRKGEVLRVTLTAGDSPSVIPPLFVGGSLRPVRLLAPGALGQFPSLLLPAGLRVSLPAGASKRVPYQLVVPRTPTPVDLMFLIDTTGSMGGVIDGLRQDLGTIVKVLDTAGLDARYGVADFRDYAAPGDRTDYPYKLRRAIGPNDDSLTAALNTLQAGGGGDGPESSLTALLQSTTGQGQEPFVAAGGQARYRPEAFKLALIAADTRFHRAGDSYTFSPGHSTWPGPDFDRTVSALARTGVHQIGLAASSEPIADMQAFALGTDALAPKGGVDCDGNGLVDVSVGGPLVCELQGQVSTSLINGPGAGGATALAGAVVSVANGIADPQRVSLAISRGEKVARLAGLARRGAPVPKAPFLATSAATVLNLKADNELAYELELRCPVAAPASYAITLTASTASRTLTTGAVQLDCGGPAVAPVLPGLAAPAAAAAAQAAAPGAAQPVQQPAPNPNPNPNPNPQANPNANPQAGAAEQQETNAQLALVTGEMSESESLAMSAREAGFVGTAGLLLCAATAVSVRRRSQLSCT